MLSERQDSARITLVAETRRAFFTPATLAVYLAVSQRTVREMLRTGVIPSYKIEGARRIKAEDVDLYLERCREEKAA